MALNKNQTRLILIFAGLFVLPTLFWYVLTTGKNQFRTLPIIGPWQLATTSTNGIPDTIYHTIPEFSFTDWTGKTVTNRTLDSSIYVADFFFTTCKTICPKMSEGMYSLAYRYKDDSIVKFISYTVDPETDSVEVLKAYANKYQARPGKWFLVTGDKKELYELARTGYLLPVAPGDGGADDFIHSEMLVLVDNKKHIRGYFDGTDKYEVDSLKDAIKLLKYEWIREQAGLKP